MSEASFEEVRDLLAKFFEVDAARLRPETDLEDIGVDSLGAVELIFELEERFSVTIPADRAAGFKTVGAIAAGVAELQRARA